MHGLGNEYGVAETFGLCETLHHPMPPPPPQRERAAIPEPGHAPNANRKSAS